MFKLGFPIWYGYGDRMRELAHEARLTGFDYLEISLDYPWPFRGKTPLKDIVKIAEAEGLSIAFHAPWRDLRFSSPFEEVRIASLKVFERVVESIACYESEYLVVHLSSDQAVDKIDEIRGEVVEAAIESVKALKETVSSHGLRLVIENVREDLEMFMEISSKADASICLDVGHAICLTTRKIGKEAIESELAKWLEKLGDRITVIHYSGIKFDGKWVRDHQPTDRSDKYLNLTKENIKTLKISNFLLEVFEGPENGDIRPSHLSDAVKFLREP